MDRDPVAVPARSESALEKLTESKAGPKARPQLLAVKGSSRSGFCMAKACTLQDVAASLPYDGVVNLPAHTLPSHRFHTKT